MPSIIQKKEKVIMMQYPNGANVIVAFGDIVRLAIKPFAEGTADKFAVHIETKAGKSFLFAARPEKKMIEDVAAKLAKQTGATVVDVSA